MGRSGIWYRMQDLYHCRAGNTIRNSDQLGSGGNLLGCKIVRICVKEKRGTVIIVNMIITVPLDLSVALLKNKRSYFNCPRISSIRKSTNALSEFSSA